MSVETFVYRMVRDVLWAALTIANIAIAIRSGSLPVIILASICAGMWIGKLMDDIVEFVFDRKRKTDKQQ